VTTGDCETWDFRFNTRSLGIDLGTYTIYALSSPSDRYHLDGTSYATIPVSFRRPTVSVTEPTRTIAKDDKLLISGTLGGDIDTGVAVWIFGRNFFRYDTARAENSGDFTYELSGPVTASMEPGEYTVIVQHPMGDGEFNVRPDSDRQLVLGSQPYPGAAQFRIGGPGALQGPAAATALIEALNSPFIDDVYAEYSINIVNPVITFDPVSLDATVNKPIIISGTTNIEEGSRILVEVTDDWFGPTIKTERSRTAGFSGVVKVQTDTDGKNFFSLEIPAGRISVGSYRVIAHSISSQASSTGTLNVSLKETKLTPTVSPAQKGTTEPEPEKSAAPVTPKLTSDIVTVVTEPAVTEKIPVSSVPSEMAPGMGIPVLILVIALIFGITIFGKIGVSSDGQEKMKTEDGDKTCQEPETR